MIVLPMAASFAFGRVGEGTFVLPLTYYFLLFLAMTCWIMARFAGSTAVVFAT
jgi:hypothetical protein